MIIAHTEQGKNLELSPQLVNRHGLIAGVTGTGKTVSVRVMAESFSKMGIPVFMADVKGDISGMVLAGDLSQTPEGYPILFWDLYGELGQPIQTTPLHMGDLLLSRLLDLNRVQSGILTLLYKVNEDNKMKLDDLGDIKSLLTYLANHAFDFKAEYGNITFSSVGTIQREILTLQKQGVDQFLRPPVFDIANFFQQDSRGYGAINILQADSLIKAPKLYCTFLLWLLSELYERMEEVGDLEQPKFVFFFDEAHLLFKDIPKILLEKIEQIVRLIRSKGVGIYFATQSPLDIPETVLAQLGNRIQHALRAFTPKDRRIVKAVAETFRENPRFRTSKVITELKTGEALISFLEPDGSPGVVERGKVIAPNSRLKPLTPDEIKEYIGPIEKREEVEQNPIILTRKGPVGGNKFVESMGRKLVRSMGNRVANETSRFIFNTFLRGSRGGTGK